MAEDNDTNMFVTLFIGVLDLHTGHLSYCNAGHDSPLLIGSGISQLPCDSNLPVGVMPDWVYTRQEMQLQSQDTIFLYTDGLNEAENVEHAQFGDNRIVNVAEACLAERQVQPATLVDRMTEAVHRFVDEAEQSDDLTMLAIKFHKQST
jgi:sigma-B regulation protein RsbU (phosphoserine phosphatase)